MNRNRVYESIDSERCHQDKKWGTVQEHPHELGAWLTLMHKFLAKADEAWASNSDDYMSLCELRKLLAVGVACAEQHGLPQRNVTITLGEGGRHADRPQNRS